MEGDRKGGNPLRGDLTGSQVEKTAESLSSCSLIHRWSLFEREGGVWRVDGVGVKEWVCFKDSCAVKRHLARSTSL